MLSLLFVLSSKQPVNVHFYSHIFILFLKQLVSHLLSATAKCVFLVDSHSQSLLTITAMCLCCSRYCWPMGWSAPNQCSPRQRWLPSSLWLSGMYLRMCRHTHANKHTHTHMHACAHTHAHTHRVNTHIHPYAYTKTHIHQHTHTHTHTYTHMHINVYTHACIYRHKHMHIDTHTHTHTHTPPPPPHSCNRHTHQYFVLLRLIYSQCFSVQQ